MSDLVEKFVDESGDPVSVSAEEDLVWIDVGHPDDTGAIPEERVVALTPIMARRMGSLLIRFATAAEEWAAANPLAPDEVAP